MTNIEWCTQKENVRHAYEVLNVMEYPNYKESLKKRHLRRQNKEEHEFEEKYNKHYIRCIETGEEFKTQSEAARKFNVTRSAIHTALFFKGTCKGCHFVWAVPRNDYEIVKETFTVTLHIN